MNILFLSELFYPHGGGAELATYLYAKLLSGKGFSVIVVTNRFGGEPEVSKEGKLTVYRLPLFRETESVKYSILSRVDVLLSGFMKRLMKWTDVVYIPRFWYSAIPLAKAYTKPVITHLHDYILLCPLSNLYDGTEDATCNRIHRHRCPKCIYNREKIQGRGFLDTLGSMVLNSTLGFLLGKCVEFSDAVVCVSNDHRNTILQMDSSLQTKLHMIYNPLPDIHYETGQGNDFGFFGGSSRLKGFHVLCQALSDINRDDRIVAVHAAGFSGSLRSNPHWLYDIGIDAYGKLSRSQYAELYRNIRCVILPSVCQETFSYVLVEALLSERIVIASKIGAIPEVSEDCEGVFLFPSGDHHQLADKILYVKQLSKDTVAELGKKNRQRMLEKFSNEKSISEFIHLIDTILC